MGVESESSSFGNVALTDSVAVMGGSTIEGASGFQNGGIDLFTLGAAHTWQQTGHFVPSQTHRGTVYADGVATDGTTVAVAGVTTYGGWARGTVWIYGETGDAWAERSTLTAPFEGVPLDPSLQSDVRVAVQADTMLLGVTSNMAQGIVFRFQKNADGWSSDSGFGMLHGHAGDGYGGSVAISGDVAAFGVMPTAPDGSWSGPGWVQVLRKVGGRWDFDVELRPNDDSTVASLAVSGDIVVVGSVRDHKCAAHVFERPL